MKQDRVRALCWRGIFGHAVHQMNAWLAEILELPARRTLRVGGGGSREVSVSYSAEELCHEAARVVLRLRNELASSRQQLACLREGGAQPQSPPPPAGWRSPKARPSAGRPSAGRKTRRRFGGQEVTCELATQTEPAEAAAQTQTEISSLEIAADAQSKQLAIELGARVRQLSAMYEQSEAYPNPHPNPRPSPHPIPIPNP